jgi:hypothetical protein
MVFTEASIRTYKDKLYTLTPKLEGPIKHLSPPEKVEPDVFRSNEYPVLNHAAQVGPRYRRLFLKAFRRTNPHP